MLPKVVIQLSIILGVLMCAVTVPTVMTLMVWNKTLFTKPQVMNICFRVGGTDKTCKAAIKEN